MIACIATSVVLLGVAGAFGYLFIAGFEFPGITRWKIFTGGLSVLFLTLAFIVAAKRARP